MAQLALTKRCTRCGELRFLADFAADLRNGDGKRQPCRGCAGVYNRAWNKANRDRTQRAVVAYRKRNPEKTAEQKRNWRISNPDKVLRHKRAEYERDREKIIARVRRWIDQNPELARAQRRKRRALKNGYEHAAYTTADKISARFELYANKCYYCHGSAQAADHRIPLSRGGPHLPANLVPACTSCNSRKHAKTEREFLKGGDAHAPFAGVLHLRAQ